MSRVESILKALINSEEPSRTDIPQSRVEYLLMQLADSAGGESLPIRILTDGEYSTLTGIPTISDPEENTLYLVPGDGSASNLFSEWIYVNNSWENIGRSSNTLKGSLLTLGQTTMTEQQLQNLLSLSPDSASAAEFYGALFPDTFWMKLTLINADVNQNAASGALRPDRPYHIATESVLHFDHALTVSTTDATLQVADRIYAEDGTFISTNNWKRSITIPANAYFRLVFRAQPDDQSVTLDITTSMAKVTFALASALDDYSTTQATTAAIATSAATKVNVAQGAANAGKALIVGNDGNVTPGEAGIADAVKTALLNLLQHVTYTDDQGQSYYDALYAALYAGQRTLVSISAAFVQGRAIYPDDTLNDLKQYLTVTAHYSDDTTTPITDYELSGSLENTTSTITVTYQGKAATFDVSVTIDSSLVYYAPRGHVLDGTNATGIDTGVKLNDTDKSFTILFDATDEEILTRVRTLALATGSNTYGPVVGLISASSNDTYTKQYYCNVGSATSVKSSNKTNAVHIVRGALSHTAGSGNYFVTLYVDGMTEYEAYQQTSQYVAASEDVFIGMRATGSFNWNGTINRLHIYTRVLSLTEIKSILDVV